MVQHYQAHHANFLGSKKLLMTACMRLWNTPDVRCPVMVELFSCFSSIDIHDHFQQGSLELERQWVTRRQHLAFSAQTLVFAQKLEVTMTNHEPVDFNTFCGCLAHKLIFNKFLCKPMPTHNDRNDGIENEKVALSFLIQVYDPQHTPRSLASLDAYEDKRAQRKDCYVLQWMLKHSK